MPKEPVDTAIALVTEPEAYEVVGKDADQDLVRVLVNSVSEHFIKMIGRNPLTATYTDEYHDGSGTDEIVLNNRPITAITGVYVGLAETVSLVEGTLKDYVVDHDAGIIRLLFTNVPRGRHNVRVTYTAGYAIADIPHDIKWAVKKAIAFLYNERTRIGVQSISTPDQITQYIAQAYPAQVVDIVNRYRVLKLGVSS